MQSLTPSIISHGALQAHSRTLVKTLTYRLLMVLVTITVAFLVTGSGSDAVNIGIAANLLKTGTYYGYERLWAHISWGLDDG
ncbi:hypothetical protein C483_08799 [Natrialba hulunbeirensis JCM 10989]|uniref:DUF2061 domain-containing protein n=1 Tax=Natrialba hulunbeirensis JCM 10989 TaxID=1227493 RepID=M0A209_9EURY|nr:DUF2061 domain-containing protein [Natrialba hulunbeirensis]ELY91877.1 hypothetical protein C483_08799 [Natrialba hulunbeirensis JCM 10989]